MRCNNKECYFYTNGTCSKKGKCLKEIDYKNHIKKSVGRYWNQLRKKYNYKK